MIWNGNGSLDVPLCSAAIGRSCLSKASRWIYPPLGRSPSASSSAGRRCEGGSALVHLWEEGISAELSLLLINCHMVTSTLDVYCALPAQTTPHAHTHMHACPHAHTHARTHACMPAHTHTCMPTHTHPCLHTHTHTPMHTHTKSR